MDASLPPAAPRVWLKQASNSIPIDVARVTRGREVAQLRAYCELSQRALAQLLGTTESTVSRLERQDAPFDARWSSHLTLLFAWLTKQRVNI